MTRHGMTFDERYRAIHSRDARFDGQFVTAVRTTGIYCRPSCPARTPHPENVDFFPTSAAAHAAGYRACKRCLPEATPGSPEWDIRGDVVGRAMRLISQGIVDREGVEGVARRLGYSTRQLNRVLGETLGAPVLALARAQRAQTARTLVVESDLKAADVAFAAGFSSVRQFNSTMREVFGVSPSELRSAAGNRSVPHPAPPGELDLALPFRNPLDLAGLFAWFQDRAVGGVESCGEHHYARSLRLPSGPGRMSVYSPEGSDRLRLRLRTASLADVAPAIGIARRLFDLDADPTAVDTALREIPELQEQIDRVPGIRVPGATDAHELLIRTMVGQQISVAAARTALGRLVAALGDDVDPGRTPTTGESGEACPRLFPTMQAIAERGAEVLRGPTARVTAVVEAAERIASSDVRIESGMDSDDLREELLRLRGVGPWTADYVRTRVAHDPDVFPVGDLALRRGAGNLALPTDPKTLHHWAARAAPWRSYLAARLWRAA